MAHSAPENLNATNSHLQLHSVSGRPDGPAVLPPDVAFAMRTLALSALPTGARATVSRVAPASAHADAHMLRRLEELGFLPGEPVRLLRRGPGGREPLAVQIGETLFALRLVEAQCVEVTVEPRA